MLRLQVKVAKGSGEHFCVESRNRSHFATGCEYVMILYRPQGRVFIVLQEKYPLRDRQPTPFDAQFGRLDTRLLSKMWL